ncbi:MAG: hypothetical protein ACJAR2_001899, partial [Ilumatobacter sp.]
RLLNPYLEGDANIVQDVAAGVGGVGAAGIRDLTVAEFVSRLGSRLGDADGGSALIEQLKAAVEASGISTDSVAQVIDVD